MPLRRTVSLSTIASLAALAALAACGDSTGLGSGSFLRGTTDDPDVGVVLSTLTSSLTLFKAGDPQGNKQVISLAGGTGSQAPTPVGFVLRGTRVAVPLGQAASVAVVDLRGGTTAAPRYFTFPSGNATGAAWVNDNTILAANTTADYVGRIDLGQDGASITQTVAVAPAPAAIVMGNSLAYVVSGNLADDGYTSLGDGVITEVDPRTMAKGRTVAVGRNPTDAALGPDGKLYVVNTNDYVAPGNISIVDPATMQVEQTVPGFGVGPGAIRIDADGLAYVSGFAFGTLVWDTRTRNFVRNPSNPVCARNDAASGAPCRGAVDADVGSDGRLYQVFFGDTKAGLKPQVFVYGPSTFQLADSIDVGTGPYDIDVRAYR